MALVGERDGEKVIVLTLREWLDVADVVWEKSRTLPWHQRPPYWSLLACINVYMRTFATVYNDREEDEVLDVLAGIPYTSIDGLDLDIVAVGP